MKRPVPAIAVYLGSLLIVAAAASLITLYVTRSSSTNVSLDQGLSSSKDALRKEPPPQKVQATTYEPKWICIETMAMGLDAEIEFDGTMVKIKNLNEFDWHRADICVNYVHRPQSGFMLSGARTIPAGKVTSFASWEFPASSRIRGGGYWNPMSDPPSNLVIAVNDGSLRSWIGTWKRVR